MKRRLDVELEVTTDLSPKDNLKCNTIMNT